MTLTLSFVVLLLFSCAARAMIEVYSKRSILGC